MVAEVESGLRRIPQQEADKIRIGVTGLLRKAKPPPSNITKEERQAIGWLKEDKELTILPADKGNAVVIVDHDVYVCEITAMLNDEQTYKEVKKDPAPSLERKMNLKLLFLSKQGSIPDKLYSCLQSSCGKTPLLYGLQKIHKADVPLRPIASFVQSPTYQMSTSTSRSYCHHL